MSKGITYTDPTYKEWKQILAIPRHIERKRTRILPTRNGNPSLSAACIIGSGHGSYLQGMETGVNNTTYQLHGNLHGSYLQGMETAFPIL